MDFAIRYGSERAPAIGAAAAYGVVLAARSLSTGGRMNFLELDKAMDILNKARPTGKFNVGHKEDGQVVEEQRACPEEIYEN